MRLVTSSILIISFFLLCSTSDAQALGVEARDKEGNLIASVGQQTHSFEIGYLVVPFLIVNVFAFGTLLAYHKKKIPNTVQQLINFISNFEISKKLAILIIITILGIFVLFSINELRTEETAGDYSLIKSIIQNWSINKISQDPRFVQDFFLYVSLNVFHNIRVIPFIGSVALVILTYFFTAEVSKKRFAGIVSMVILLQSNLFLNYDSMATYNNFWTLFYFVSLYTIYKKWYISPVSYILSIFSKGLTLLFLPITLLCTYRADISHEQKIKTVVGYAIILIAGTIAYVINRGSIASFDLVVGQHMDSSSILKFDPIQFLLGFKTFSTNLRFDELVLFALLPLIVILFMKTRSGNTGTEMILIMIPFMLITPSLFVTFVNDILTPYRLIPLVVVFAIGVGTLFSRKTTNPKNIQSKGLFPISLFLASLAAMSFALLFLFFPDIM